MSLPCVSALISRPCRAPSATHVGPLHCISQAPKMRGGELPAPELRGWIGAPGMTTPKLCMIHPLFLTPWKLNNESEVLATLFTSQGAYLRYPGTKSCCCCTSLIGTGAAIRVQKQHRLKEEYFLTLQKSLRQKWVHQNLRAFLRGEKQVTGKQKGASYFQGN